MSIQQKIQDCTACAGFHKDLDCFSASCPPIHSKKRGGVMFIGYNPLRRECDLAEPFISYEQMIDTIVKQSNLNADILSLTYAIKGFRERGKPGSKCMKECSNRFLIREINYLQPKRMVVFGAELPKIFLSFKPSKTNTIAVSPWLHLYVAPALGAFYRAGLDSLEYKMFLRELTSFLSDDYEERMEVEPYVCLDYAMLKNALHTNVVDTQVKMKTRKNSCSVLDKGLIALDSMIKHGDKNDPTGYDIETKNVLAIDCKNPRDYLLTMAFSNKNDTIGFPIEGIDKSRWNKLVELFLLLSSKQPVVGHHLKFDLKPFIGYVRKMPDEQYNNIRYLDTMLISHLLNENEPSFGLKQLLRARYGIEGYAEDTSNLLEIPIGRVIEYNMSDAYYTRMLLMDCWRELPERMRTLALRLHSQLIMSTTYMEVCGLPFNQKVVDRILDFVGGKIKVNQNIVEDVSGSKLNTKSGKQLNKIANDNDWELGGMRENIEGVSFDKKNLTKLVQSNRGNEQVAKFARAMAELNKYRDLQSKYSGTTKRSIVRPEFIYEDGRIHTGWRMNGTGPGRFSSSPNISNIHRADSLPREMFLQPKLYPRAMFRTEQDNVLVMGDLKQAELKVLACYSKDEALVEAYKSRQDLHAVTATKLFHVLMKLVEDWQRQASKTTNFGIIYGISKYGLCDQINDVFRTFGIKRKVTPDDCQEFIEGWFSGYPQAAAWIRKIIKFVHKHGYVDIVGGRNRRWVLRPNDHQRMAAIGREACNAPIQGTAALLTQIAQNRIFNKCRKEPDFKLVKNEYDSVAVECLEDRAGWYGAIIKEAMTFKVGYMNGFIIVPFDDADVKYGRDFANMTKLSV